MIILPVKHLFVCCLVAVFFPNFTYGWGGDGHEAIGQTAERMLSEMTKADIATILGNTDLAAVSTWMDDARAVDHNRPNRLSPEEKLEARAFNSAFKNDSFWHFVDLPVGTATYRADGPFALEDDVVHAIGTAIDVLEGKSTKYSKLMAMRVLVHMVGDIHQPMHCVSGYYEVSDLKHPELITDPLKAKGQPDDRGGNQLFYTTTQDLHAFWDTRLVGKIGSDPADVATQLRKITSIEKWQNARGLPSMGNDLGGGNGGRSR